MKNLNLVKNSKQWDQIGMMDLDYVQLDGGELRLMDSKQVANPTGQDASV